MSRTDAFGSGSRKDEGSCLGRPALRTAPRPAPPHPAPPRPPLPVGCPGFRFDKSVFCRTKNPDILWAGRVGAAHGGAAGRGGAGHYGTPTDRFAKETTVTRVSLASKTTVLNASSGARTKEILCKPIEEQNQRLTSDLFAGPRPFFVPCC